MERTGFARFAVPLLVGLVAIALAPSIGFPYVWDAVPAVSKNALVQHGSLSEILTSDYWRGTAMPDRTLYRPVTVLSFALERRVLGASDARVSHLVNLLLHAAVSTLLVLFVRRVGGCDDHAAIAGLIFACHPLLLLTAVNVAGRADILASGFSLAALWCVSGPPRRVAAWGGGALLLLALGSKEVALATPCIMALSLSFRDRDKQAWLTRLGMLAPSGAALLAYLGMRTWAIEAFPGGQSPLALDNVLVGVHGLARVATVFAMAARYVALLVFPHPLSHDYSGSAIAVEPALLALRPLAGVLALGVLLVLAFLRSRLHRVGGALFLIPYLLVGNIVVLSGAGFAERLIYFSATGFCLLVATGLLALYHRLTVPWARRTAVFALAGLLVGGVLHARSESRAWTSDEALLEATLRATPRSLRAHFALAEIRMRQRRDDEALRLYDEALRLAPSHEASWLYKGVVLARRGDLAAAERCARRALALQPDFGESRAFLGIVLRHQSRFDEAERELRKALVCRPPILDARAELGLLLFDQGRYEEAARYLRECVERGMRHLQPKLDEAERRKGVRPL